MRQYHSLPQEAQLLVAIVNSCSSDNFEVERSKDARKGQITGVQLGGGEVYVPLTASIQDLSVTATL